MRETGSFPIWNGASCALRLKKVELNRAETRVHNFIEFIASGRATPTLADALSQAEEQVKSLSVDIQTMEAAKDHAFTHRPAPGSLS